VVDLVEALRVERDARVKERILAVKLVCDGFTLSRAAEAVGRTKRTAFNWVEGFREGGVEALRDRPRKASRELVAGKLKLSPKALGYDVDYWIVKLLRVELAKEGVDYSLKRLYRIIEELGCRLIRPRPRHHRARRIDGQILKKSWRVD
jgi:transposase